ncbi:MAG TPA: hypothetical protein VFZ03_13445 [Dongiaceae bacterium]
MTGSIGNLREIARCCSNRQPLAHDLAQWLGRSIDDFLSLRVHNLDEAMGLRKSRGGVPWWREEAIRERDGLLRQLARVRCPGLSVSRQASQVFNLTQRYAAASWRFDRELEHPPTLQQGAVRELLWRAFKSGARMPVGERCLRTILRSGTNAADRAHPPRACSQGLALRNGDRLATVPSS